MPHLSRKQLSPRILKQILNSLVLVLTETKNREDMANFLDAFLSKTEKIMLAKRIAIVWLLTEGVEGEVIAKTLNVTPFTVSRIKLWYETKGGGYRVAIAKLKKEKVLNLLKDLAIKATVKAVRWAGGRP